MATTNEYASSAGNVAAQTQPNIDTSLETFSPDVLKVNRSKTLSLNRDALLLTDSSATKRSRNCGLSTQGGSSARPSIPLYNVLWAEQAGQTLTIDYAHQVSPTKVKPSTWTFTIDEDSTNTPLVAAWIENLMSRAYGQAKRCKRAKVLVNPHAGPGGAEKKWENWVKPLFKAARMPMDVARTEFSGEAVEIAENVDIEAFDTIVACSGDGLPHEVFNGLGKRPDARRALQKIAVSHIPCGSGNAMSCNLNGTYRVSLAALAIIKGVETPFDLISITQGDRRVLSFLSQALGIVAEADLATEHLRWMGGARFTWGFLVRVFEKKCFPCDLAVKVEIEGKDNIREHYKRIASDAASSRLQASDTSKAESSIGDSSSTFTGSEDGLPPLKYGTVNDKLPEGWELISHDKMGNFYCGNMSYMAADANFFSAASANDGLMDLVCIDGDISPISQLGLMMSVEDGTLFSKHSVSYRKVSAYRIIPRDQDDGYISIDGEKVPFEPFQAEIHKGLGKVISKLGVYDAPGPSA